MHKLRLAILGTAAVLALGVGIAPAAGFSGHGKSNSGAQMSERLSAEASEVSAQASSVGAPDSGVGAPASQGSQTAGNTSSVVTSALTNGATVTVAKSSTGVGSPVMEGARKFDLLGPNGIAFCDGSGVISGAPGDFGFAIINAPNDKTVEATVFIEKQKPNTKYVIRLVQGQSDCFTVDATVMTNGQGNATVHLSEASTSSHALIAVDTGVLFGAPTFVTKTYTHA